MVSTSPLRPPHLTTAADKGQAAIERHAAIIRKLKEQERDITEQHEKLQFMIFALESRRQEYMQLEFQHDRESRRNDSPPPLPRSVPAETPGPHRLLQKAERPVVTKANPIAQTPVTATHTKALKQNPKRPVDIAVWQSYCTQLLD